MPSFPWIVERQRELDRDGETLHFHATDHDGEWMITLRRGGVTREHDHGLPPSWSRVTAGDLLILVLGRLVPAEDPFAVTGNDQLLTQWLKKSAL
jgi:hypothetical protein